MMLFAWSGPLKAPPFCDLGTPGCDPPVNVGPQSQTKWSRLDVGSFLPIASPTDGQSGNLVPFHIGLRTPSRLSGGALCFFNGTDDCRYSWAEVRSGLGGGGGGGGDSFWQLVSGTTNDIVNKLPGSVKITSSLKIGDAPTSETVKLDVPGGLINSSGGFILENRTSNPTNLVSGRMWLCTANLGTTCAPTP